MIVPGNESMDAYETTRKATKNGQEKRSKLPSPRRTSLKVRFGGLELILGFFLWDYGFERTPEDASITRKPRSIQSSPNGISVSELRSQNLKSSSESLHDVLAS